MFEKRENVDYIQNFYRFKRYKKDTYLLTTDDGNFIFVNKSSLKQLRRGKIVDDVTYGHFEKNEIILTKKNIHKVVKNTAKRYAFLVNGTSLHIVIPTSRCNLNCSYCFATPDKIDADKKVTDLDEQTARKIVEFIFKTPSDAITIEFQGGEAIARFDLLKLMTLYAKELNEKYKKQLHITMTTNLTLFNDEIANWLVDNGVTICTSLDGPKEIHDKNRIIQGAKGKEIGTYDKVVYWIDKVNKLYKEKNIDKKVNALMTITKYSLPYHKEIIDEYMKHNLNVLDIRSLTMVGKAVDEEGNHLSYSFKEYEEFYKKCIKYINEIQKKDHRVVERIRDMFVTKILEKTPTYHTDYESPCGAATGQITYHSNGDIYTCHEALGRDEFKLGNVYEDTWSSVFRKEETSKAILNSMLEANVKCDRCAYKPYCGTCMVENFYQFGKFNYYPTKTPKHHETIMQCDSIFNQILRDLNIE